MPPRGCHALGLAPRVSRLHHGRNATIALFFTAASCLATSLALADDGGAKSPWPSETISRRVKGILESPGFEHGHWGLLVVQASDGRPVFQRNADQLFAPASVTKLFSSAAALVELGADFRFETPVFRRGDVDGNGILHGDLILLAQGDPSMGGRTGEKGSLRFKDDDHTYAGGNPHSEIVEGDPLAGLDHLARDVRAAGIRQVQGEVIIDDRYFEAAESTGSGPSRVSPIVINDNVIDILIDPSASAGSGARVEFLPATQFLSMDAQVETVESTLSPSIEIRSLGPRQLAVRGKVPAGHRRLLRIQEVEEPSSFARAVFIECLRRRGVAVSASPLAANSTASLPEPREVARLPRVGVYTSPPFREFLKVILKVSHNLHASTLPLLIAARHGERTLEVGLRRQGEILKGLGIDPATVCFAGGAGGSRADFATPRATVQLLRAMAARPDAAAFSSALPILGRDGTLVRAVDRDSPARGHVHAKTGTYTVENELTGKALLTSKALAGYMETAGGKPLVFAFFVNNVGLDAPRPGRTVSEATTDAGRLLGKLAEVFYRGDGEPSPSPGAPDEERTLPDPEETSPPR